MRSYELSADGKKLMLVRNQPNAAPEVLIIDAAPKLPAETAKLQVRWSDWQIATQPRAEWKQMFADAWRMHRDHFYDKDMHGVDWVAVRAKYEPLVDRVTDRYELAELMAQMVSELGALHSQVAPGDTRAAPDEPGLAGLGGRFSRAPGGWRIDAIYAADPELPSEASPLAAPGLGLKVGDIITTLNGRPTADAPHLLELLRGQAGRQVLVELKQGEKSVQRIVTPVAQVRENQLRYNDWRVSRARAVEQAGQGRIGYVHLRAMGAADIADFVREFYAANDRDGLIIDVRYNNGGNIDSWILEKLLRRAWAFWQPRSPAGSPVYANMQNVYRGHTVVLMNEDTYSDGETFAEGFKRLKLGPVIGKQSSGAGVWLSDGNRLLDNGIMRAAETGQMDAEGRFLIEGVGVTPDIDVDNPPRATAMGQDAQLDRAIAELKKRMAEQPVPVVKPGPYLRPVKP
ncbi:MAG: PDZ domain-containing protein [Burkholderiales bacterium]|nr:PDZ domain-containing protein [Burkholderiales bacterium]